MKVAMAPSPDPLSPLLLLPVLLGLLGLCSPWPGLWLWLGLWL